MTVGMARFIKAVADRIVCSPIEPKEVSDGGIILGGPPKERPMAVILSVGDAVNNSDVKPGAVILWKRDLAVEFKLDGIAVACIGIEDIIGVIDNELDFEVVYTKRKADGTTGPVETLEN
jgi:co-chaperonin GroES (HSP10)